MSRTRTKTPGDPTPVTGGVTTPARLLRPVPDADATAPADELDKHILRLLTLHKDVPAKLRDVDLGRMDHSAKRALLADLQNLLGIDATVQFPR